LIVPQIVCNIIDLYVYRIREGSPEFLVLRRSAARELGGTWQAVHGKIEAGETAWQAALRELREETGLTPIRFHQIDAVNTFYVARQDAIHLCPSFAAQVECDAAVRLNEEHDAYEWLDVEATIARLPWPGLRRAVREICTEIIPGGTAEKFLRIEF
jgi:dihydroneopterin triphosphate diphosphatase